MGKILIVEDEKKISRILKLQLERKNHEITIIENGIDALNEIHKKRDFYDLMLLDLGLPSMEGNEVCKNVRKISKVPITVSIFGSSSSKMNLGNYGQRIISQKSSAETRSNRALSSLKPMYVVSPVR